MNKLHIIGNGGFASEFVKYFRTEWPGMPVEHSEGELDLLPDCPAVIAVGSPEIKRKMADKYPAADFWFFNFSATTGEPDLWHHKYVKIGQGSIICPGVTATTGVNIGKHVLVNLHCTIGHGASIGDYSTLSPGVHISGDVSIGAGCYIGTGAVIREKISICDGVTIGAGAVVVKDITEPGVYVSKAPLVNIGPVRV